MSIRGDAKAILREPELVILYRLDSNGVPKGITGTITSGNSAGGRMLDGIVSLTESYPAQEVITVPGNGGVISQYKREPSDPVTIDIVASIFDQTIIANLENRTVYTEGAWKISMQSRRCITLKDIGVAMYGRAESQASGNVGEEGWWSRFYWNCEGELQPMSFVNGTPTQMSLNLSATEVDQTWWEEDLNTNYDQDYSWVSHPIIADYPIFVHTYVGDGTTSQTFTTDYTPANSDSGDANAFGLWEDGTKVTVTTGYTVTVATKTVAYETSDDPANNSDNVLLYEGIAPC